MNTDTQTGRGKLISAQELMAELSIGRTWLRELMNEGMPFVCLNPNTPYARLRRYRYNLQAVNREELIVYGFNQIIERKGKKK